MFKINGEIWKIYYVFPNDWSLRRSDGTFAFGVCDDPAKAIYLANNLNPALSKQVLCHEITHSAMFSYNINLSIEQEELFADLMATFGEEIIDIVFTHLNKKRGE